MPDKKNSQEKQKKCVPGQSISRQGSWVPSDPLWYISRTEPLSLFTRPVFQPVDRDTGASPFGTTY